MTEGDQIGPGSGDQGSGPPPTSSSSHSGATSSESHSLSHSSTCSISSGVTSETGSYSLTPAECYESSSPEARHELLSPTLEKELLHIGVYSLTEPQLPPSRRTSTGSLLQTKAGSEPSLFRAPSPTYCVVHYPGGGPPSSLLTRPHHQGSPPQTSLSTSNLTDHAASPAATSSEFGSYSLYPPPPRPWSPQPVSGSASGEKCTCRIRLYRINPHAKANGDSTMTNKMLVKRQKGRMVHWAPSSEIVFVKATETPSSASSHSHRSVPARPLVATSTGGRPRSAVHHPGTYQAPTMRMDAMSLGDEVRFATSPDVIAVNGSGNDEAYHPDFLRTHSPRERQLRVQVATNRHGLVELNLANLELRGVPPETFNFTRIEVLSVAKNRLSTLPGAVGKLRRLKLLDAHHNHLQVLPETLTNCSHLQELDLSHNRLASLPASLGSLRQLRVLKLGHNQFETVPAELGHLETLRQLDLPGNRLWHLPGSLAYLANLHLLNLGHNRFEQLPICICQLRQLEAVDLRGNELLSLPPDCENWKHLKELNISSNRLETVPHCLSNLRNLHSLDLSHNKVKVLPPRMARLPKLRVLMACNNQITLVPNNLEALEYLNLADNQLKNFSVSKMRRLKYLNVNQNALENLPLGVCNLSHLEVLKLNTNRISYVSQDIILLKNLRTLDLGHNKLSSLPHVINELEQLETFNVQGNRLDPGQVPLGGQPHGLRELAYLQLQQTLYPAQVGRQNHSRHHAAGGAAAQPHYPHPVYDGKRKAKKSKGTQYQPHSRTTAGTQYTPRSGSTRHTRERPPLDYVPSAAAAPSLPPSYPHSKSGAYSERTAEKGPPVEATVPTEISFPHGGGGSLAVTDPHMMEKLPLHAGRSMTDHSATVPPSRAGRRSSPGKSARSARSTTTTTAAAATKGRAATPAAGIPAAEAGNRRQVSSYTSRWLNGADGGAGRGRAGGTVRSNAATVNGSVGDELSLGEEDYDFQPTTVRDHRLLDVCKEVEAMLNKELLEPWVHPKGIFKKSLNERGTMRMLNGLRSEQTPPQKEAATNGKSRTYQVNPEGNTTTIVSPTEALHVPGDIFMQKPLEAGTNGTNVLLRTKADQFDVTPAGGLFKSSVDPNISVYFPVKAISEPMTITLQLEKIDQEALLEAKRSDPIINNILAMGHVVHVTQSRDSDFDEQVTLTVPAPPAPKRGRVHLLTYHEDNTCSPCPAAYKTYQGYISLQAWHFSGKGAVLTKSKCKYKACKSVEQLLNKLYI